MIETIMLYLFRNNKERPMEAKMKQRLQEKRKELLYILIILGIMIVQAIRYFPFKFGGWNQIQLSFSYAYGFIQRAFLGTILDIISSLFHIPLKYMRYIYGIGTVALFSAVILLILYKVMTSAKIKLESKSFLAWLGILFMIGPGWSTYYNNFANTDVWLLLVSLFGVYFVVNNKCLPLVVLISSIGILIHQSYVFMYFNLILVFFLYKWMTCEEKNTAKRYFAWGAVTFVVCSGLFLYMQFFSRAASDITMEYVMNRTAEFMDETISGIQNHESTISMYLFRNGGMDPFTGIKEYWTILIAIILVYSPFILEVICYWKAFIKKAKQEKQTKYGLYMLYPFGILTAIPLYIMHVDYGRWTYGVFFYEFALVWILNMIGDNNAEYATQVTLKRIRQKKIYFICLMCYAALLGAMEQNLLNDFVHMIADGMYKIIL